MSTRDMHPDTCSPCSVGCFDSGFDSVSLRQRLMMIMYKIHSCVDCFSCHLSIHAKVLCFSGHLASMGTAPASTSPGCTLLFFSSRSCNLCQRLRNDAKQASRRPTRKSEEPSAALFLLMMISSQMMTESTFLRFFCHRWKHGQQGI